MVVKILKVWKSLLIGGLFQNGHSIADQNPNNRLKIYLKQDDVLIKMPTTVVFTCTN